MKMIIAPTDFSSTSQNAVAYAADMALSLKASLLLVHIIELPFTAVPVNSESYDATIRQSRNELFQLQEKIIARTSNAINIETYIGIGTLMSELNKICSLHEPLTVVMGTEDRDMIEKFFTGNSTKAAVHYLQYPVLVVPATATYNKVNKICFACDFKDIYDLPVDSIKKMVTAFNAKLDIVHVCKNERDKLQNHLAATLIENELKKLHPTITFVIDENIDNGIRQYTATQHEDVLLLIPKKRTLMDAVFHKSHTSLFSAHATVPVLNIAETSK